MQRTTFASIGALALVGGTASVPAAGSTVAYYRMEGTGAAATLTDSSGNGYNLTTVGSPNYSTSVPVTTVSQTGQADTSSLFLAGSQYATYVTAVGSGLNFSSTTPITIETYVKLNALANGTLNTSTRAYVELAKPSASPDSSLNYSFMAINGAVGDVTAADIGAHADNGVGNQLVFSYASGGTLYDILSSLTITDTNWHFISVAVDPTTGNVRFTEDSSVDAFTIASMPTPTGDTASQTFMLGDHTANGATTPDFTTNAFLDEVRTSNVFLPTSQLLNAPEPSSLALLALGGLPLLARRRKSI